MHIIFEPLYDGVEPPERATAESAGYDLKACLAGPTGPVAFAPDNQKLSLSFIRTREGTPRFIEIPPGYRVLVPLGFKAQLPAGYEAQVRPRSGLTLKSGLTVANSPGTIDADYPNEWGVILRNDSETSVVVVDGDRIAQCVFAPVTALEFAPGVVGQTTERAGGFGSTGQ